MFQVKKSLTTHPQIFPATLRLLRKSEWVITNSFVAIVVRKTQHWTLLRNNPTYPKHDAGRQDEEG